MEFTPFAGLTALDENDPLTVDGASFLIDNPRIIDHFLRIGCLTHRHDNHAPLPNPSAAMTGSSSPASGALAASATFALGYTVTDAYGGETMISPPLVLTTGPQVNQPTIAPSATVDYTQGIMPWGAYYYAMSYTDGEGGETPLGPSLYVYINPGYASASIDLSALATELAPHGNAVTWRLWRSNEGADWHLVTEGSANTYLDSGFDPPDNPAVPAETNTTNEQYSLTITLPAAHADPALASGTAINIYLAADTSFLDPCFYATFPISSAGGTFTITQDNVTQGRPPEVSHSIFGAAQINSETDIIDFHWLRPVASSGSLPPGKQGDVRLTLDTGHPWTVLASAGASAAAGWTDILTLEQDTAPGVTVADLTGDSVVGSTTVQFAASGAATVGVAQISPGVARVTVAAAGGGGSSASALPPDGPAGGDLSGTYPNPGVARVNGVAVTGTPASGQVLTATGSGTADWQTPSSSGGGGASAAVAARAHRTATLALAGAWQKVPLDTLDFDSGSNMDVVTNGRFNCPVAGYYQVNANGSLGAGGYVGIYKNGSPCAQAGSGNGNQGTVSDVVHATAGDYIELWVNSAGSLSNVGIAQLNFLSIALMG